MIVAKIGNSQLWIIHKYDVNGLRVQQHLHAASLMLKSDTGIIMHTEGSPFSVFLFRFSDYLCLFIPNNYQNGSFKSHSRKDLMKRLGDMKY